MSYYEAIERPVNPPYYSPIGYCHKCGNDIFNGDEIFEINGEWYCEECIFDNSKQGYDISPKVTDSKSIGNCAECNNEIFGKDDVTTINEDFYCEKCIHNLKKEAREEENIYVE